MIRKGLYCVLGIIVLVSISGCAASRRFTILETKSYANKEYSTIEVAEIKNMITRDKELLDLEELRQEIIKRLEQSGLFAEVTKYANTEVDTLIIESEVVSFEKGDRFARYMVGFGAGKSFLTLKCKFKDKQTGEVLSIVTFDGELSMGMFGGSYKNTYTEVATSMVEYLKDIME